MNTEQSLLKLKNSLEETNKAMYEIVNELFEMKCGGELDLTKEEVGLIEEICTIVSGSHKKDNMYNLSSILFKELRTESTGKVKGGNCNA